jgi:phosphocarrier protein HPr
MWPARFWPVTGHRKPHSGWLIIMIKEMTIKNSRGLHARASAKFVQCAEKFNADINVMRDGQKVEATSIMGLMMLAAGCGSCICVEADGSEAAQALEAIQALVDSGFGEDDITAA